MACDVATTNAPLNLNVIGPRSVIVPADPIEWSADTSYEYLTLVSSADFGQGYVAKRDVPSGTPLTNTDYWIPVASFNAQLSTIQSQIGTVENSLAEEVERATSAETSLSMNTAGSINLASLGVKAEDGFDNKSIIQDAIDSNPGKVIVLPDGEFEIHSTIDISNGAMLYCIGTLKAVDFVGNYVVTVNARFSNPNVENMTSFKNHVINVDCNDLSGVSGVGVDHCYRCYFKISVLNTCETGLNNAALGLAGNAENVYHVTVFDNTAHAGSVGVSVNANDSVFYVFTREVETGIESFQGGDFPYVHCWLFTDTLWSNSCVFRNHTSVACGIVKNDTMRYFVNGDANSVVTVDQLYTIMNTNIVSTSVIESQPYAITTGSYNYLDVSMYADYYKAYITDSEYVEPNTTTFENCYSTYEYRGDMLRMPCGVFWIDGTGKVTNAPSLDSTGTWCAVTVTRGHNYNFIELVEQATGKVWRRTSLQSDQWRSITFS